MTSYGISIIVGIFILLILKLLPGYTEYIILVILLWMNAGALIVFPKIPDIKKRTTALMRFKIAFYWPLYLYWLKNDPNVKNRHSSGGKV